MGCVRVPPFLPPVISLSLLEPLWPVAQLSPWLLEDYLLPPPYGLWPKGTSLGWDQYFLSWPCIEPLTHSVALVPCTNWISLFFFSLGRPWPVALGTGFGLGYAFSNCQHDFRRVDSVYLKPKVTPPPQELYSHSMLLAKIYPSLKCLTHLLIWHVG